VVVVSIFVNPTQFGEEEDLRRYPRSMARDRRVAREAGADLVFAPTVTEMYPEGYSTWVDVEGLTEGLCGSARPGHFRGVCTIVAKLFNVCRPQRAYFGEKDAQQLAVVKRMVRDLDFAVEIVPCPTVREPDGVAMSSRNIRLTENQRAQAPLLWQALSAVDEGVQSGELDATVLLHAARAVLAQASLGRVDYIEIVNKDDLTPVTKVTGDCLVALAVLFGDTRLIDNITVKA
jgi:pantoate--beta-alanine ligase